MPVMYSSDCKLHPTCSLHGVRMIVAEMLALQLQTLRVESACSSKIAVGIAGGSQAVQSVQSVLVRATHVRVAPLIDGDIAVHKW